MPVWWLLPAAAQGISSIAKWYGKRKALESQKGFGGSQYERELQRQMKEGTYSPKAENNILGQVSRRAGQVAQIGKTNTSGYMQSRGLGGSMISQSAMKNYDTNTMNKIAETTREIEMANEASKAQAKERFAMERYKDRIRKGQVKADKYKANAELFGGVADAVGTGYQAYKGFSKEQDKNIMNIVEEYKKTNNPTKLHLALLQMGLTNEQIISMMEQISQS